MQDVRAALCCEIEEADARRGGREEKLEKSGSEERLLRSTGSWSK